MAWLASKMKAQQLSSPQSDIFKTLVPDFHNSKFLFFAKEHNCPIKFKHPWREEYNAKRMLSPESRWHSRALLHHYSIISRFPQHFHKSSNTYAKQKRKKKTSCP